jgi:protein CpxP
VKNLSLITGTAAIVIALAGAGGAIVWSHESSAQMPFGGAHGMPGGGQHLARLAEHIEAEAGTTPEQKAQIDALVAQASTDFKALHAQLGQDHGAALAVLTQDRIDRTALESVRLSHMRLADQASVRITQLLGDIAEVLTPEQRKTLAAHVQQRHAH